MKKRDAYHPDYLKIYPCLKDRPDILKFLRQCDRKQEYLEYDLKVNRIRKSKRTMETVVMPQKETPMNGSWRSISNSPGRPPPRRKLCSMK